MRIRKLLILIVSAILIITATACAAESEYPTEYLSIKDAELRLDDSLLEYLHSNDHTDIALVTVVCRS